LAGAGFSDDDRAVGIARPGAGAVRRLYHPDDRPSAANPHSEHFGLAETEQAYDVFSAAAKTHALKVVLHAVSVAGGRSERADEHALLPA
jgi:hypothetical protein